MNNNGLSGHHRPGHTRRGKFTENLLDVEAILMALDIRPGQTILDAGCGNGYMSRIFSGRVAPSGKVVALDLDGRFIEALGRQIRGTNILVMEGDITQPTMLNTASIDLIYISTVVHIFSSQQMQGFLQEAMRLLKPDALLAVVEIEKKATPFGPPLKSRYAPRELIQVVPMMPGDTVQVGEHFYMQTFQNRCVDLRGT